MCWGVGGGKGRCMGRCGGWGVGVWVELWKGCWVGVGVGKREVGVWGSFGRNVGNPGKQGSVGSRVVSRSGTPTLLTPTPLIPTLLNPTPRPQLPQPQLFLPQLPRPCVFWPQGAFSLFLNCELNARFVEYLEETKLEFFQT